jgi:hypothetical protein
MDNKEELFTTLITRNIRHYKVDDMIIETAKNLFEKTILQKGKIIYGN